MKQIFLAKLLNEENSKFDFFKSKEKISYLRNLIETVTVTGVTDKIDYPGLYWKIKNGIQLYCYFAHTTGIDDDFSVSLDAALKFVGSQKIKWWDTESLFKNLEELATKCILYKKKIYINDNLLIRLKDLIDKKDNISLLWALKEIIHEIPKEPFAVSDIKILLSSYQKYLEQICQKMKLLKQKIIMKINLYSHYKVNSIKLCK